MPYFQGQAVGDDYLQGELARYRAQNPGAAADDQSILNVLEGRAQPTWETRGQFAGQAPPQQQAPGSGMPYGLPPGVAPPWGQMPQQMAGQGWQMPLSQFAMGGGGGMGMAGGYGYGARQPQWKPSAPGGMYGGATTGLWQQPGQQPYRPGLGQQPTQGQMYPLSQMAYPRSPYAQY